MSAEVIWRPFFLDPLIPPEGLDRQKYLKEECQARRRRRHWPIWQVSAKAYAASANQGINATGVSGGAETGGFDFGSMVKNAMTDAMHASKNAETQIAAHTQGKAQLIDVATAISAAETSHSTWRQE